MDDLTTVVPYDLCYFIFLHIFIYRSSLMWSLKYYSIIHCYQWTML